MPPRLINNGLFAARMLNNGASILVDGSIPDYAFFHLELDRHGIPLAEGLPTENRLDVGNRGLFAGLLSRQPRCTFRASRWSPPGVAGRTIHGQP